jgi:hypothetical protein
MWIVAPILFFLAFVARIDLFATGSLYSSTEVWASNTIVAALGFWAAVAVSARVMKASSWESRFVAVGAAIAVPAALVGAVELVAPVTPAAATAPACAGAPVAGAPFRATTPSNGMNARSGPDTNYPQVQRFAGDCTLAFDGYCIGEPSDDLVLRNYPDQRWLIVHRPWQTWPWKHLPWGNPPYTFVAASKVQSQSAEIRLGAKPAAVCAQLGGWTPPRRVSLRTGSSHGVVHIGATAEGSVLIGLSIMSSKSPDDGSDPIFSLTDPAPKRADASGVITALWYAQAMTGPSIGRPTTLTLVASVCLGPAVPDPGNYAVKQFAWTGAALKPLADAAPSTAEGTAQRLQAAACRVAPDYPKAAP